MAASSGEEDNYWPGYVDALTTMTMVLTFILMVLGITIFSLSQNVSRSYLESIAEAAGMKKLTEGSLDKLKDRIVNALQAEHGSKQTGTSAPAEPAPAGISAIELPPPVDLDFAPKAIADAAQAIGAKPGSQAERRVPGDGVAAMAGTSSDALVAHEEQAPAVRDRAKTVAGTAAGLSGEAEASHAAARRVAQDQAALSPQGREQTLAAAPEAMPAASGQDSGIGKGAQGSKGEMMSALAPRNDPVDPARTFDNKAAADVAPPADARFKASDASLTIVYRTRTARLEEEVLRELRSFAGSAESKRAGTSMVIRGYATTDGSVTENRRQALYRAMVVRSELVAAGIPAKAISVRVQDTAEAARAQTVQVSRN